MKVYDVIVRSVVTKEETVQVKAGSELEAQRLAKKLVKGKVFQTQIAEDAEDEVA